MTASGTNQVHGSVYEFLRNRDLDARNLFGRKPIPQFQRNEFGGAIGGPVRKNKVFLFGNYEAFRQRLGLSDVTFVPDDEAHAGYLPNANGQLTHIGVNPSAAKLPALWPLQNGPDLGSGIGLAYSNPKQSIREDFTSELHGRTTTFPRKTLFSPCTQSMTARTIHLPPIL